MQQYRWFIVNSRCWLLTTVSTCFGHLYVHHQEKRPRVIAYGVYLLVVLDVAGSGTVVLRWGCEHCEGCCSAYFLWRCGPTRAMPSSFLRFLDHTRRITVGRTAMDEWSARRRDLYLTTHNTHKRQTTMHPVGFEPTISARERPQTYALDRTATGTGVISYILY